MIVTASGYSGEELFTITIVERNYSPVPESSFSSHSLEVQVYQEHEILIPEFTDQNQED